MGSIWFLMSVVEMAVAADAQAAKPAMTAARRKVGDVRSDIVEVSSISS